MHRWTLLAPLVLVLVPACGDDKDPAGPTTTATQPTQASDPSSGGVTTTNADTGELSMSSAPETTAPGTTGVILPGTDTSASGTTTNPDPSSPTIPDPTNGPDPTETAFIQPMTDEGGDPSGNPSSDPSSDPSGGGVYGQCGWSDQNSYYDCAYNGATPDAVDPSNTYPIDCPDGLMENGPCDEMNGPVGNVGCCDPGGTLYYCTGEGNVIVKEECGA